MFAQQNHALFPRTATISSLQSPSGASACNDLVYGLNDRPDTPIALPAALQHLPTIIVPIVIPGLLICQALGVSPYDTNLAVPMSLVVSGIATFARCRRFGPFGVGLLIVQGASLNFVDSPIADGALMVKQGMSVESVMAVIFGVVIAGSLVEIGTSRILSFVKWLITPLITGIVVLMIDLTLIKVSSTNMGGGFSAMFNGILADDGNLLLSSVVLGIIVVLNHIPVVWVRSCAIVITLAVGYALADYFSHLDFTGMHQAELFQIPTPLHFGLDFSQPLFIPMLVIYLVASLGAIGDVTATSKVSKQLVEGPLQMQWAKSGVLVNGANSFLAGIFSIFPNSVLAQNNGVIQLTGVANRYVGLWIAAMLVLLSLLPGIVGVIQAVPEPILGGAAMMMFGAVAVSGISIPAGTQLNRRALLIIAVSLALGLGVSQVPELLAHMPATLRNVLESGVAAGGICALLLSWFLPKNPVRKAIYW